jgi:hypothetical protein
MGTDFTLLLPEARGLGYRIAHRSETTGGLASRLADRVQARAETVNQG